MKAYRTGIEVLTWKNFDNHFLCYPKVIMKNVLNVFIKLFRDWFEVVQRMRALAFFTLVNGCRRILWELLIKHFGFVSNWNLCLNIFVAYFCYLLINQVIWWLSTSFGFERRLSNILKWWTLFLFYQCFDRFSLPILLNGLGFIADIIIKSRRFESSFNLTFDLLILLSLYKEKPM